MPVSIDNNEENQLRRNLEQEKSSTVHPDQPPAIPPRPVRPALFLQQSINKFERVLGAHQRQTKMQNREISKQERNLAGTDNHVPNPFSQAQDTLLLNSATDDTKYQP